jgi:mannosyl-3-phosphoglycerate phosphatase
MTIAPTPENLVVFTDLDATLLDHETYSWEPARPALTCLREQSVPVILCSSKTLAEMQQIAAELELHLPLVVENGAAIALPPTDNDAWSVQAMGTPRTEVLHVLHALRDEHGWDFQGFGDWDDDGVALHTGLPTDRAARARQRHGTEPILWHDSDANWQDCLTALAEKNLRAVAGGRFIHVMGHFDKADGMQAVLKHLQRQHNSVTVALGDSPNDEAMLSAADIAVVIQSPRTDLVQPTASKVIRTLHSGPAGWNEAMQRIIQSMS